MDTSSPFFVGPQAPAALGGPVTGAETASFSGLVNTGLSGLFGLAQAAVPAFIQAKLNSQNSKVNSTAPQSINTGNSSSLALPITGGALLLVAGVVVVVLLLRK